MTSNLSLNTEIDKQIAKAAAALSKLSKRAWNNNQLTLNTKLKVYQACVLSHPAVWQHLSPGQRSPDRRTTWKGFICIACGELWVSHSKDKVTNAAVLEKAGSLSMHLTALHMSNTLAWTHRQMENGHITKDLCYGELATGIAQ